MTGCYVFQGLAGLNWWRALDELESALEEGESGAVAGAYSALVGELVRERHSSLATAAAEALCAGEEALAQPEGALPSGLRQAALVDLRLLRSRLERDWQGLAKAATGRQLPPLRELAAAGDFEPWASRITAEEPDALLDALLGRYRACGTGLLARHRAFRWRSGRLEGVERPARDRLDELVGLERQLERLTGNVERFLAGAPALHALLYGPRGSGKSTAVRSLLDRYCAEGLRLVEVGPESLLELPELAESLRDSPHRFLVFIDDLSFEAGETGFRPLKTLLEGSVAERPGNVLLMATSNRRHLVRESLFDRPMPENEDVHAWDTANERLALADRFGLLVTFPPADQRQYLVMVRELARFRGIEVVDAHLDSEAIRFAEWGNGYSGRTARQFVDTLS